MNEFTKHLICGIFVLATALAVPMAHADPLSGILKVRDDGRQNNGWLLLQQQLQDGRGADDRQKENSGGRQERLSPEERQQLRRDIKDAGRQIYPQKKRK